ncbi:MAG TPA: carboxymuconolactone decarboxylase family protein [Vicinamibacterales bacterium]|nr:carboxymuconolactone decarboxylase family protein [Vicinamibacterales bacterium]
MTTSNASDPRPAGKLPGTYVQFAERFPELAAAHKAMGAAAEKAGPLDGKTCELIRMGIALGAGQESSFRSHVRRALELGARREEVEQAIVLSMTTCGFSRAVAGWKWAQALF